MLASIMTFIYNHPIITSLLMYYASSQYVHRRGLVAPRVKVNSNEQEDDEE